MRRLILTIMALTLVGVYGCSRASDHSYLPNRAANVTDEGNGWHSFDWKGHRYLTYQPQSNVGMIVRAD